MKTLQEVSKEQRKNLYTIREGCGNVYLALYRKEVNAWFAYAKVYWYGGDCEQYEFFETPKKVLQKHITRLRCPINKNTRR